MSLDELIVRVHARPELWQPQHPYYNSRNHRLKVWRSVAEELNCKDSLVRKRWKHLKDKYRKELKKIMAANDGVIPEDCISTWHKFGSLYFLREDILRDKTKEKEDKKEKALAPPISDTDISEDEHVLPDMADPAVEEEKLEDDDHTTNRDETNFFSSMFQNRLRAMYDMTMLDPDLLFLVSLLPSVKTLTDIQKLQFRGKVNQWLLEIMAANECSPQLFMEQHLQEPNEEVHTS